LQAYELKGIITPAAGFGKLTHEFLDLFRSRSLPYLIVHPLYGQSKQLKSEVAAMSAKYVFVTGGVVSSLGKGLAAASIGCLLESRGLRKPDEV
jgi:hypothetical protein